MNEVKRKCLSGVLSLALVLLSGCAGPEAEGMSSAAPSPAAGAWADMEANDTAPGREDGTDAAEKFRRQSREEFYGRAVGYEGVSEDGADVLYQRLLDSGVMEREEMMVTGMAAGDYDGNGSMDMIVCLFSTKEDADYYEDGCLYLFMNEDAPCRIYEEYCPYGFGALCDDFGADIDGDGRTEVAVLVQGTGNGGAGDSCKIVVKYQESGIQKLELPGGTGAGEYEIRVDVKGDPEKGVYTAFCPEMNETITFSADRKADDMPGGNCRGFYSLRMGEYQGEEALLGYEYLYAGGIAEYVGDAVFVIAWNEEGSPYIRDWYIEGDVSSAVQGGADGNGTVR